MSVRVAVAKAEKPDYPRISPYHPSEQFPEYPFGNEISTEDNFVYSAVRELFQRLEYDSENFGFSNWNPLGWLVKPKMTVVIKPNFVCHRNYENKDIFGMITHGSVLRAVSDYVWIALKGQGRIIIADAPQYDGNWEELLNVTKIDEVSEFFNTKRNDSFEIRDLRNYWSRKKHFPSMIEPLDGDLQGSLQVNLGNESAVRTISDSSRLYGAVYHRQELVKNHSGNTQIYELSKTVMEADVVISVPKLKTHKKVGVTMNIKGLVGICTNKNLIVHYSLGSTSDGGDQYPPNHFTPMEETIIKIERWMYDFFLAKQSIPLEYIHRSIYWLHGKFIKPFGIGVAKEKRILDVGNWYGNDSAWRMCVDLFKILVFSDRNGMLQETRQRRLFTIIDGIIGGENNGPLAPDPNHSGVLIASDNLFAADIVGTRLMGFDPHKIKMFANLLADEKRKFGFKQFNELEIRGTEDVTNMFSEESNKFYNYQPHQGWIGHIEI